MKWNRKEYNLDWNSCISSYSFSENKAVDVHIFFSVQVRLSTGKDLRLSASMADTIGQLKKQLQAQYNIDTAHQRWFFSGKLLTDKTRLQDTKIQKDFVIQVIVNPLALQDHKLPRSSSASLPTPE